MKKKAMMLLFILFAILHNNLSVAQSAKVVSIISLQPPFNNIAYEFSSVTKWNSYILLIPTLKNLIRTFKGADDKVPCLYLIPSENIKMVTSQKEITIAISSLKQITFDRSDLLKKVKDIKSFDGIEGCVVIGNDIYFSIETHDTDCYILKCNITPVDLKLHCVNILKLPKPNISAKQLTSKDANAGYEAFTNGPGGKLLAIYEDAYHNRLYALLIDTNFNKVESFNHIDLQNIKRIPEACSLNDSTIVLLETCYNNDCDGGKCHYFLNKYNIKARTGTRYKLNNFDCKYNWEGMMPYEKGYLIINDNQNGKNDNISDSKLIYIVLNDEIP